MIIWKLIMWLNKWYIFLRKLSVRLFTVYKIVSWSWKNRSDYNSTKPIASFLLIVQQSLFRVCCCILTANFWRPNICVLWLLNVFSKLNRVCFLRFNHIPINPNCQCAQWFDTHWREWTVPRHRPSCPTSRSDRECGSSHCHVRQ